MESFVSIATMKKRNDARSLIRTLLAANAVSFCSSAGGCSSRHFRRQFMPWCFMEAHTPLQVPAHHSRT